ncbi:MAG: shikimate kinase [Sulfolobales archaeon]
MNISLIGFMGSGKTTVGRLLARKLGLSFVDLDKVIENKLNMKINDVFSKLGEDYFRNVESEVIKEIISDVNNAVIACGGGIVLREDNIEALRKHSVVIYLRISADEAYRRLKHCNNRPLLKAGDRKTVINNLLMIRDPLYLKAADIVIDVDRKTPNEVVDRIINRLRS